jgi:glycosyltransferase involved in cell wall biosynthesis
MVASPRLKVFQVLVGGEWAGGAAVVHPFVERLIQEGYDVWVLCLTDEVSRRFEEIGAHIIRSRHWKREINWSDLFAFLELFRLCRQNKFDIVHAHTSKGGFFGRIAARLAGVPIVIYTIHGFTFNELSPRSIKIFYTFLERLAAPFCDLMIAVAEEHRRRAIDRKIAKPDQIITIHNGIHASRFDGLVGRENKRDELPCPKGSLLAGSVGRLVASKGPQYLLKAIPLVLQSYPHVHFLFVGDGPQKPELISLASELGIDDHCHFLGFRRDVPELLACFDVFVLPSPREGLSISILEAMASALPVVATNVSGNRELIDSGVDGILVKPADPAALAEAIITMIRDQARARAMGERARHKVKVSFSQEKMIERTLQVYTSLYQGDAKRRFPIARLKGLEAAGEEVRMLSTGVGTSDGKQQR